LPVSEIPLTLNVAPFAIAGKPGATIALVVGVQPPAVDAQATHPMLSVLAEAYDLNGNSVASKRMTMDLGRVSDASAVLEYEVRLRLDVPAGRYELRVGTETSGKRRGSVYAYADVPDYAKNPLSVSGLVLERTPASPTGPGEALSGVLPVVPTTTRQFAPTDQARAFLRIYEGRGSLAPARVSARIVDDRDAVVFDDASTLDRDRFARTRAADYTLNLPLARLAPGEYLLTIETTVEPHRDRRDARFTVR
jgi:hypothetical protein